MGIIGKMMQTWPERAQTWVDFGQNVKKLRTARGWTQTDLSERLAEFRIQMHQTTIAKLENGTRPTVVDEIWALATIFGVSYDMLLPQPKTLEANEAATRVLHARRLLSHSEARLQALEANVQQVQRDRDEAVASVQEGRAELEAALAEARKLGMEGGVDDGQH